MSNNTSIASDDLDVLTADLDALLKEFPQKRRELHGCLGRMLQEEVNAQIAQAGFKDGGEKLKSWQEMKVGSGGGYTAVRPTKSATGSNSPGAITNYNEAGHKIRKPKAVHKGNKKYRYRPKINVPYVDGRNFYEAARRNVEAKAIQIVEEFVDELAKELEG
ncbi:hypothetical protein FL966_05880 [Caproiciproducens galactitolivorans]|nr:hypothetical protein [Caproiciproducens galactitolivorans]QEY34618.1 hypothetical protein FL966_05880 [Caproiciproducens galactitolivorans]